MSKYILLFSVFLFINCNKRDECVDITDKKEINGLYYFYFKAKMTGSYSDNQGNSSNGFSPYLVINKFFTACLTAAASSFL